MLFMSAPLVKPLHVSSLTNRIDQCATEDAYKQFFGSLKEHVRQRDPTMLDFFDSLDYGESPTRYYVYDLLEQAAGEPLPVVDEEIRAQVKKDFFDKEKWGNSESIMFDLGKRINRINPRLADLVISRFFGNGESTDNGAAACISVNDGVVMYNLIDRQYRSQHLQTPPQTKMPWIAEKHIRTLRDHMKVMLPGRPELKDIAAKLDRPLWCNDPKLGELSRKLFGDGAVSSSYGYFILSTAASQRLPQVDADILQDVEHCYSAQDTQGLLSRISSVDATYGTHVRDALDKGKALCQLMGIPAAEKLHGDLGAYLIVYDALRRQFEKMKKNN